MDSVIREDIQNVKRPEIIVTQSCPDTFEAQAFTVVHISLVFLQQTEQQGRTGIHTLVGSSRRTRLTHMTSSRSVNQPLGRNQAFVCVGDGGIRKNVRIPIVRVIRPLYILSVLCPRFRNAMTDSIMNSHRQPARPRTPRIRRTPNAMKLPAMLHALEDIQKRASRMGSSLLV
jgi:hypothetical protein